MNQPRQKKFFSQVFLKDPWPCQLMADELATLGCKHVVEIGPGNGILTEALLDAGIAVTAIERDPEFAKVVQDRLQNHTSLLKVICCDILKTDLSTLTPFDAICGNIPYHISTPILQMILPFLPKIKSAMFLVQLEFAKRLAAQPNSKSYGSLSVFTQLRSEAEIIALVERDFFRPVPKVDSAIIGLSKKILEVDPATLDQVERITKTAFQQRRKKLSNSLAKFIGELPKDTVINLDLNRRCDSMSLDEFLHLGELGKTHSP